MTKMVCVCETKLRENGMTKMVCDDKDGVTRRRDAEEAAGTDLKTRTPHHFVENKERKGTK